VKVAEAQLAVEERTVGEEGAIHRSCFLMDRLWCLLAAEAAVNSLLRHVTGEQDAVCRRLMRGALVSEELARLAMSRPQTGSQGVDSQPASPVVQRASTTAADEKAMVGSGVEVVEVVRTMDSVVVAVAVDSPVEQEE
jgi:hypothetical protein